jgi:hypothetical protein
MNEMGNVEMICCDVDSRFSIIFDHIERRFNVKLFGKTVYGSDKYPESLKWVNQKGYLSMEKYLDEM